MQIKALMLGMVFLVMGALFFSGRGIPLLKEWKRMTEEERGQFRVDALGKNAGLVFFSAGILFELAAFIPVFRKQGFAVSMVLWLIAVGINVYDMEKNKRYLKQEKK